MNTSPTSPPAACSGSPTTAQPTPPTPRSSACRTTTSTRGGSTCPSTPLGSTINQIESYFSIVQRKALTPNDFADVDALARPPSGLRPARLQGRPAHRMDPLPRPSSTRSSRDSPTASRTSDSPPNDRYSRARRQRPGRRLPTWRSRQRPAQRPTGEPERARTRSECRRLRHRIYPRTPPRALRSVRR